MAEVIGDSNDIVNTDDVKVDMGDTEKKAKPAMPDLKKISRDDLYIDLVKRGIIAKKHETQMQNYDTKKYDEIEKAIEGLTETGQGNGEEEGEGEGKGKGNESFDANLEARDKYYIDLIKEGYIGDKHEEKMEEYDNKQTLTTVDSSENGSSAVDSSSSYSSTNGSSSSYSSTNGSSAVNSSSVNKFDEKKIKDNLTGLGSTAISTLHTFSSGLKITDREVIESIKKLISHPPNEDKTKDEPEKKEEYLEKAAASIGVIKAKIDGIVTTAINAIDSHRKADGAYKDTNETIAFIEDQTQKAFDEIQMVECKMSIAENGGGSASNTVSNAESSAGSNSEDLSANSSTTNIQQSSNGLPPPPPPTHNDQ
jgi:hypothetical protein